MSEMRELAEVGHVQLNRLDVRRAEHVVLHFEFLRRERLIDIFLKHLVFVRFV